MFTGLVTGTGTIQQASDNEAGRELRISADGAFDAPLMGVVLGESIAINGICLTVREIQQSNLFSVAAVSTTLERTTAGDWKVGNRVNLERAMLATDRFGGHIVQGHVDGVGTVTNISQQGSARIVDLEIPGELDDMVVLHGSITVDGVSLTVNALPAVNTVQLSLIEYTLNHTNLGALQVGQRVNIEADIIAKYVQKQLQPYHPYHPYGSGNGFRNS
jgi:riboflavin synthase